MMNDNMIKICIDGDEKAGKTKIVTRYINNEYDDNYQRTIGATYNAKTIKVLGVDYKLCIWDTSGKEIFRSL